MVGTKASAPDRRAKTATRTTKTQTVFQRKPPRRVLPLVAVPVVALSSPHQVLPSKDKARKAAEKRWQKQLTRLQCGTMATPCIHIVARSIKMKSVWWRLCSIYMYLQGVTVCLSHLFCKGCVWLVSLLSISKCFWGLLLHSLFGLFSLRLTESIRFLAAETVLVIGLGQTSKPFSWRYASSNQSMVSWPHAHLIGYSAKLH